MLRHIAAILALVVMATASSDGEYTIMYSTSLRAGTPLEISVLMPRIDEAVTLTATLSKFDYRDGTTILHTETRLYQNIGGLNQDTWPFNPPAHLVADYATYRLNLNGTGGVSFSNTSDITVTRKTNSVFIQTDKAMYKPGQMIKLRVYQFNPDLQPMYDSLTVSLKDSADNLLMQVKNISRSEDENMGVVKAEYQLSDQPVQGQWKIEVTNLRTDTKEYKMVEVGEYVLPKFEVEMKFEDNQHLANNGPIKGKVCAKYTYGKEVSGNATVSITIGYRYSYGDYFSYYMPAGPDGRRMYEQCGSGEYCPYNYTLRRSVCRPNQPCPAVKHSLTLENGCAEIELSQKERYFLYPSLNKIIKDAGYSLSSNWEDMSHAIRQKYDNMDQVDNLFNYKVVKIKANVTEEATGKTLSGEHQVQFIDRELSIKFSDQMEKNFKPGLPFRIIVELKGPDGNPATPEMLKDLNGRPMQMELKVFKELFYYWETSSAYYRDNNRSQGLLEPAPGWIYGGYRGTKRVSLYNFTLTVPSDGTIVQTIDIPNDVNFQDLSLQAKTTDRYGVDIQMSHNVDVHKTKTNNQLSLSKTLVPGGKDQPGSIMNFQLKATTEFNKIYYFIMGKGQVRRQDVIELDPPVQMYNLSISLDPNFARQISPSGRILILTCIRDAEEKEEMLAASLDFSVDGAMANHLNLRFAPNDTLPGKEVTIQIETEANSYVTMMAMDQSMILLAGNGNDVSEDDVMNELRQYDNAGGFPMYYRGRRKRSFWCPWCWPYSRGGDDPFDVVKNAGAVVLSNCPLFKKEPERNYYYGPRGFPGRAGGPEGDLQPQAAPGPAGGPAGPSAGGERGSVGESGLRGAPGLQSVPGPNSAPGAPAPPPPALAEVQRVRQEFPESWIWTELEARSDGTQELKVMAPDTITTWQLSGMSLNSNKGLGLSNPEGHGSKLRVFKPFFISLDLPYHMIKGEEAKMQITVFNYQPNEQEVKVTLKMSNEYIIKRQAEQNEVIQQDEVFWLKIAGDDSETVAVYLRPTVITSAMEITVHAQSPAAADAVTRKLVVKPSGKPEEKTESVMVILDGDSSTFTTQLRVSELLPQGADREKRDTNGRIKLVPGSEYIYVSAQGDLMGSTLDNLGSLVRMPYGCGEQNMVNFVPNIHVLRYLKAVNKATPTLEEKAKRYMRAGYSRELTYQHRGGGFSAFGDRDDYASTWLTAFVMKSFQEADEFITIDPNKIQMSLRYLLSQQDDREGYFEENGKTHSTYLKGGSGKGDALTAYVLSAMETVVDHLEDEYLKNRTKMAISKSEAYLNRNLLLNRYTREGQSSYTMAIVAKALVCSSSTNETVKQFALDKLMDMAIEKDGKTHWAEKKDKEEENGRYRWWRNPSTDVERTAYGAMALLCKQGRNLAEVIPIIKWLISQQGPYGGYSSTQDTVLSIGVLADFTSEYSSSDAMSMDITLKTNNAEYSFDTITSNNAAVLQKQQLDKTAEYVNVMASGTTGGIAVVQLVVKYYTEIEPPQPKITVDVLTSMVPGSDSFSLTLCGKLDQDEDSEMGVLSFTLPTGYTADTSNFLDDHKELGAKRIEKEENKYNVYVDKFTAQKEMCFGPVVAEKVNDVMNLQDAQASMFDYYNNDIAGFLLWLPPELRSAGLPGGEIEEPVEPGTVIDGNGNGSGSLAANVVMATITSLLLCLFLHQ